MQGTRNGTLSRRLDSGGRFQAAGLARLILTFALVVPVAPGLCISASAQPPGPELFAKEPQTPLELLGWLSIIYSEPIRAVGERALRRPIHEEPARRCNLDRDP